MSQWASLGGFGNVDMRASLPVGQTDNTGALGMIARMLLRKGAQQPRGMPEQEYDPEAELEMARLLGLVPQAPTYASLGMRGH